MSLASCAFNRAPSFSVLTSPSDIVMGTSVRGSSVMLSASRSRVFVISLKPSSVSWVDATKPSYVDESRSMDPKLISRRMAPCGPLIDNGKKSCLLSMCLLLPMKQGAMSIRAFVVGHDWGSIIAYYFALFRPDRVTALVNVSVPYTPRDPSAKPVDSMKSKFGEGYYMIRFQEPGKVEKELNSYDPLTIMKKLLLLTGTKLFGAPLDKGILENLKVPESLPSWITEEDLQYFAKQFAKTGFTGGLNYYRALDLNWELTAPWTGAKLTVPTKFITGDKDPVYATPGMKHYIHGGGLSSFVPNLDDIVIVEGAHHFLQQERPKEVSQHLLKFFGRISAL